MDRDTSPIVVLSLCALFTTYTEAEHACDSSGKNGAATATIVRTGLEVSDRALELRYNIRNTSQHDIWICEKIDSDPSWDFETYLAEDGQTLLIRRRLDVPEYVEAYGPHIGRYVRLSAGAARTESLFLTVPIFPRRVFVEERRTQGTEYVTRLALEIGYYTGDLPRMVAEMLQKTEEIGDKGADKNLALIRRAIPGFLQFNELNEYVRHRDEEVLIPYTWQAFKGEQVLLITADGLRIPYSEEQPLQKLNYLRPDLTHCNRLEIDYRPSMLDYFFHYTAHMALLSSAERQYLQSVKTIVVKDQEHLKALAHDVNQGFYGGIITDRSMAHIVCYRDGERLMSFTVYDDMAIVTEDKQRLRYDRGIPCLRILTTPIQPFELRVRCADNLWDLWSRLRSLSSSQMAYPMSTEWCDAIVRPYKSIGMLDQDIMRAFKCPGASKDKCTYAMNPDCKPNSPPDLVLLFETKAGWNQHGGPELFTFDNHDPKGGCVLLNDGTVKFIRSKEELQNLRWK